MIQTFSMLFNDITDAATKQDKIALLQKHDTPVLRQLLRCTYDNSIVFDYETARDIPEFKSSDSPVGMGETSIQAELRRAYLFVKDHPHKGELKRARQDQLLIQILEGLEAAEALVWIRMLLKKQQAKGLTYNLVKEVFPDLIP